MKLVDRSNFFALNHKFLAHGHLFERIKVVLGGQETDVVVDEQGLFGLL